MTGTAQRWTRPIPAWAAPLDSTALHDLLERVRGWQPFDGCALLDDVAAALDDVFPAEEDTAQLAERLRAHLARLATIAVASEAEQDPTAAQLVLRARTLHADPLPCGRQEAAIAHLRRLGWTANELHDRLVAIRCLKEAA
ncbi:hypothetical protein FB570_12432 [Streptomyces sp. T12]|uniref:DUF6415 family natural product biosynthesis protein n=1 Tax=Streptomyces sp. T12 TaxID=477697 RepID=UPI0011ADD921|nr:DUF6415 family natural product biosynthesis protein [Streptomyces sp. T12]TWD11725.1 hypothetical protein FB570_12432 [Streptomyces sp. T12]